MAARNPNDRTTLLVPVTQAYAERCGFNGTHDSGFYCWASGGGLDGAVATDHYATEQEAWDALTTALAQQGRRLPEGM